MILGYILSWFKIKEEIKEELKEEKCVKWGPTKELTLRESLEVHWLVRQMPYMCKDTATKIREYLEYEPKIKVHKWITTQCLRHNKVCHIGNCYSEPDENDICKNIIN